MSEENIPLSFVVSKVVARRMMADSTAGSIVNVSSQASLAGLPLHTAYCASKGAMDAATRVMAVEFGEPRKGATLSIGHVL